MNTSGNNFIIESQGIELTDDEDLLVTVRKKINELDTTTYRYLVSYVAPQSKESLSSFKPQFYYQLKEEELLHWYFITGYLERYHQ